MNSEFVCENECSIYFNKQTTTVSTYYWLKDIDRKQKKKNERKTKTKM